MKNLTIFFLFACIIARCSPKASVRTSEFPLDKGTTWVYAYETYEPTASNPNQIIKVTYQVTENVVETKTVPPYFVAHVKREHKLIDADAGWLVDFSSQPNEFWYVVNDHQVLQSNLPLDTAHINIDKLIVDYEFPLSVKKSWCLFSENSKGSKKPIGCEVVGRREVISQGPHKTPAGNFEDCYDLIDYFNGGNIFQKFCGDVGIVSMKFDHAGTRFGFEQTLISYTKGVP